jgi:hypothetical protein
MGQQTLPSIVCKPDGTRTKSTYETAIVMLNTFFPELVTTEADIHLNEEVVQASEESVHIIDNHPFTQEEVNDVIKSLNSKKAPGDDFINAEVIKRLNIIKPTLLLELYNKCFELRTFPKPWKRAIAKIIPKVGYGDASNVEAFRPICLLSVLGKVLEKLMINRINWWLLTENQLSNKQFGFLPQRSTEQAIHTVVNFAKESLKRKGFCLLVSLDISGAFDHAIWSDIINQLKIMRCPSNLIQMTESYFTDRSVKLYFQEVCLEKRVTRGCPQGSVGGPSYWVIMYDNLLRLIHRVTQFGNRKYLVITF